MANKRLTVELPAVQYDFLQQEANRTGTTIVGLIRRLIDDFRLHISEVASKNYQTDPLYKRRGSFDGPADLAEHHDHYLYGQNNK